jgi:hypothetical protein
MIDGRIKYTRRFGAVPADLPIVLSGVAVGRIDLPI